jgi:ABC-type Fe3+/spermidine/putrescine transport system ATPase subunit
VFLDEPTTGVDPASRRQLWDFIAHTMRRRAVVLTTHSMEECEALCQRIGILIDGHLACIGSAQHLKDRFANGFQLGVQLAPDATEGQKDAAQQGILAAVQGSVVTERAGASLKFRVPKRAVAGELPALFAALEQVRLRLHISQYALGQETLENIFLRFVNKTAVATTAVATVLCYCQAQDTPHAARYHCSKCQGDLCEAMTLVHQKHGGTLVPVAGVMAAADDCDHDAASGSTRTTSPHRGAAGSSIEMTDF